jgi:anti-sigma factor RsiW
VRPFDKHIDNKELNALVPSSSETGHELHGLSPEVVSAAERHVRSCIDCSRKVSKYRLLVSRFANAEVSEAAPPGPDCPNESDVDWHEVAAGLWPELKARQLIMHAALCDHCGPLLRAATSVGSDSTLQEENLLADLKAPSRPNPVRPLVPPPASAWRFMRWLVPAAALVVVFGVLASIPWSSPASLSGPKYAEFAVKTHRQHAQGSLALDVRSDSQQAVNEWFKKNLQFSLTLPTSPAAPGEDRPYRLEGARLVQVGGKTAAFVAYQMPPAQMPTAEASLMVAPDSVAVASGGVEVDFKKIRFHYARVDGYKVVTWSLHGLTYALVSEEGNDTQKSCMVCHSAMRDRDLSHTPTPLRQQSSNTFNPIPIVDSF